MKTIEIRTLDSFVGTAKAFEDGKISLNGEPLTQVAVNLLAKHGLFTVAGEGDKPQRGRTPKLYRATANPAFKLAVFDYVPEAKAEPAAETQTQETQTEQKQEDAPAAEVGSSEIL